MRHRFLFPAIAIAVAGACTDVPTAHDRAAPTDSPSLLPSFSFSAQSIPCDAGALIDGLNAANLAGGGILNLAGACTYSLAAINNYSADFGINGLPVITGDVTINGNGATIKRDSLAPDFRIFYVLNSGDPAQGPGHLTLNDVTVSGGKFSNSGGGLVNDGGTVTVNDGHFTGNESGDNGGGVANIGGTLTLNRTVVTGNSSSDAGGGVSNVGGTLTLSQATVSGNESSDKGGGVSNEGGTVLILSGTTIAGNTAGDQGGGVNNARGGILVIDNSTITANSANDDGGGVANDSATVTIRNRTAVTSNGSGDDGAGVANTNDGVLTIEQSTLESNIAGETGGALYNYDATATITASTLTANRSKWGAGVFNEGGEAGGRLTVRNSTLSGNEAEESGGGIFNYKSGSLTLVASTIAGNRALIKDGGGVLSFNDVNGHAEIKGSIVAGNTPHDVAAIEDKTRYISLGYNVIGVAGPIVSFSIDFLATDDQRNVSDPGLGPLQNNGGPTFTRALVTGSPALNRFAAVACSDEDGNPITHDQRGVERPAAGDCDVGAFELEGSAPQLILFDQPPSPRTYGSVFTVNPTATSGLPVTLTAAGGCTASGFTVTMTSGVTPDCVLTASQAGNENNGAAEDVIRTVVAQKAPLTVAVQNEAVALNATPSLSVTHTGFVSGEGTGVLDGAFVLTFTGTGATVYGPSTTPPPTSASGTYSVMPSGYSSNNYAFVYVAGTLTIGGGIRFESQTTAANAASPTLVVGRPAGLKAGELLLAQITYEKGSVAGSNSTITPSGWTLVRRTDLGTDLGQAVFSKIAGASEPVQYTWTFSQSVKAAGSILRYSGVRASNPVVPSSGSSGVSSTLTAPSVNSAENSVVVAFYSLKKNSTSLSVPAGMTARHYFESPLDLALRGAEEARPTGGTTGSRVSIAGHAEKWIAQLVVLQAN